MKNQVFLVVSFFAIICAAIIFDNPKEMPREYSGAFFSGAANIKLDKEYLINPKGRFQIDTSQIYQFMKAGSTPFKFLISNFKFPYHHNSIGFAWICKLAKTVFWFLPDIKALEWLQILLHSILSMTVIYFLNSFQNKILFLLLYALNPLILYVVTYPYYYCWMVIPAFVLLPYLLKNNFIWGKKLWLLMIFLGCILASRSVIFPSVILIFYFIIRRENKKTAGISFLIFLMSTFLFWSPNQKNQPFTAYLGLGAYTTTMLPNMNNETALRLSPIKLNPTRLNDPYYDNAFQSSYRSILKKAYLEKAKAHPFLVLRNAILNIGSSFSIGYLNDYSLLLRLLSAFGGFIFIGLLLYKKLYMWVTAIFINGLGFVLYYPPIQIYMFGNYILLVCAFIVLINSFQFFNKNNIAETVL